MRRIIALAALAASAAAAGAEPKLVMVGDLPKLPELAENVDYYEAQAPFDGVSFLVGLSDVFNPNGYSEWVKDEARANGRLFKHIEFKRWKYNFLAVLIDQHKPKWFDEDYWETISRNWGTAARYAKQIGMVGICFDPEGYGVYPVQSYWKSSWWVKGGGKLKGGGVQPPDVAHTEKDYLEIARKRGRQVGEKVFKEYPEIVFWSYYWWSFGGDLMGAFCNGLLDVMPPMARLIDGEEWSGYCAKGEEAYVRMAKRARTGCGFVENRLAGKLKAQGGFSPSFYMDAYARPEASDCLTPTIFNAKSPVAFFESNLRSAKRKATGGHIWIYGEKNTWFTPPPKVVRDMEQKGQKPRPTWEDALPGIRRVLFGNRLTEEAKGKSRGKGK